MMNHNVTGNIFVCDACVYITSQLSINIQENVNGSPQMN